MNKERFTTVELKNGNEYVFDKYLFSLLVGVLLGFAVVMIIDGGLDANKYLFVECKTTSAGKYCENPLYNNPAYCGRTLPAESFACTQEFIPDGVTMGKKAPAYIQYFDVIVMACIVFGFLLNHLLYNRGKFRGLKLDTTGGKE